MPKAVAVFCKSWGKLKTRVYHYCRLKLAPSTTNLQQNDKLKVKILENKFIKNFVSLQWLKNEVEPPSVRQPHHKIPRIRIRRGFRSGAAFVAWAYLVHSGTSPHRNQSSRSVSPKKCPARTRRPAITRSLPRTMPPSSGCAEIRPRWRNTVACAHKATPRGNQHGDARSAPKLRQFCWKRLMVRSVNLPMTRRAYTRSISHFDHRRYRNCTKRPSSHRSSARRPISGGRIEQTISPYAFYGFSFVMRFVWIFCVVLSWVTLWLLLEFLCFFRFSVKFSGFLGRRNEPQINVAPLKKLVLSPQNSSRDSFWINIELQG